MTPARDLVHVWRRASADEVERLERDPDAAALLLVDSDPDQLFDVGRAWHAVHALLSGSADPGTGPAAAAVLGGLPLGDPSSYEPVRLLPAGQVVEVAELLRGLRPDALALRFDAAALRRAQVYPDVWDDPAALSGFVLPAYARLRAFYAEAAAAGDAVLLQLQ